MTEQFSIKNLPKPNVRHIRGHGGKGDSGAASMHVPVEDANTLATLTYMQCVDLLCEGPIRGFVHCGESIFFDDTPFQNADNTFNFVATSVDARFGYPDQTPMDGFPDVETPVGVGVEVTHNVPIVRSIDNLQADQLRVTLSVRGLFWQDASTGDVHGYSVGYLIEIQQVDGPWIQYPSTLSGKTRSEYAFDTLISLPNPGPWNIRITKTSLDDASGQYQSQLFFESYTSIKNRRYTYGDSVVVGTKTNAQAFGGKIPTRTFEIYARIIQIPTNYNPDTREYTGMWDGTFKNDWTNNPAWVLYDILTFDRAGLGRFIGPFVPDKWRFYEIARYCDEMVPDGFGGLEPRFTFNGLVPAESGRKEQAFKAIQEVAAVFRGMVFYGGGSIWAVADMPADPVQIVTQADVIDGRFTYSGVALTAQHFQALMTWKDPNQRYKAQVELVQDLTTNTWNQAERSLNGCTSRGEAHRYGKWILDTEKNATQTVAYTCSWEHAKATPGDIVAIADPQWAGIRFGGRLASATVVGSPPSVTTVQLDAPYDFGVGSGHTIDSTDITIDSTLMSLDSTGESSTEYLLTVALPSGRIESRIVTNVPGLTDIVTVDQSFSEVPLPGALWVLTGDVQVKEYRILSVKEVGKALFEITGLEHDPSKYARIEQDIKLDTPIAPFIPGSPLAAPTNLVVSEEVFKLGGAAHNRVLLSWTPANDPLVMFYEVAYFDPTSSAWISVGRFAGASAEIDDLNPGIYSFRVRSGDVLGRFSSWLTSDPIDLAGLNAPPPDVTNFRSATISGVLVLSWDASTAANIDHYVIRYTPTLHATNWATTPILQDDIVGIQFITSHTTGTFMIKAVSQQGIESTNATILGQDTEIGTGNVVQEYDEEPDWLGTKTDVEVASGNLILFSSDVLDEWTTLEDLIALPFWDTGFEPNGEYLFNSTLDLGDVYVSHLIPSIIADGVRVNNFIASWTTLSSIIRMSGADSTQWAVNAEYRTTNDDPGGSPTWSSWTALVNTSVSFRAIQFRLRLSTTDPLITPVVSQADVIIDMPDRQITGNTISAPSGGLHVTFTPPMKALTNLQITGQASASGDYFTVTGSDGDGFDIQWFNAANVAISHFFDYLALGYGKGT